MTAATSRKETPISMRLRDEDVSIIDRGARLSGLSRTEFMRRAAVKEAQTAILNETVVRLSADDYARFLEAIAVPAEPPPPKTVERLSRKAPWTP